MINFRAYSVFDSKAGAFSRPVFYQNDDVARRAFDSAVNSVDSEIGLHPEDFALFWVGEWNEVDGKLSGYAPEVVVNGMQLKRGA